MTGLSGAGEAAVLTPLTTTAYVSLHTADPGNTGASEVSGSAYARTGPVAFTNAGNNPTVASNSAIVTFRLDQTLGHGFVFRPLDGGRAAGPFGVPARSRRPWRSSTATRRGLSPVR